MVVIKSQLWSSAAAVLVSLSASAAAHGAETASVVLRLKDSGFEYSGELRSFDGAKYVLAAPSVGLISLDAASFDCEGEACSGLAPAGPSIQSTLSIDTDSADTREAIVIDGSATIGLELMPQIIRDYASHIGGTAKQVIGASGTAPQFKLADASGKIISSIEIGRTSSAQSFAALAQKQSTISMVNRAISNEEAAAMPPIAGGIHGPEGEVVLALDALAVLVAPGNPAKSISVDKLAQIYSGKITNWSELGLPAGAINLYAGATDTGATESFDALVMRPRGLTMTAAAQRIGNEIELSDAVARDPQGLGVASLAFLRNARALAVAGACGLTTAPSVFAVKSEQYPLSRRLYLYTAGLAPNSAARGLLAFASSKPAQASVAAAQFIDQEIEHIAYAGEGARFEAALNAAETAKERSQARSIIDVVKAARRLSSTFRFASGSSQLDAKAREDVKRLAAYLKTPAMSGKSIVFAGYADSIGGSKANAELSYRRAEQIRDAVFEGAASNVKAVVIGASSLAPVVCNESDEDLHLNRRVEVWVR